jgi:hypothetical protein
MLDMMLQEWQYCRRRKKLLKKIVRFAEIKKFSGASMCHLNFFIGERNDPTEHAQRKENPSRLIRTPFLP